MLFKHIFSAVALSLLTSACASAPSQRALTIAWDGLGRDPNLPVAKQRAASAMVVKRSQDDNSEREKVLATMRPYSQAWWAVHDEIEAANDRWLNSRLAICKGCFVTPQEATGSISDGSERAGRQY